MAHLRGQDGALSTLPVDPMVSHRLFTLIGRGREWNDMPIRNAGLREARGAG